jgi:hypothetical protein
MVHDQGDTHTHTAPLASIEPDEAPEHKRNENCKAELVSSMFRSKQGYHEN